MLSVFSMNESINIIQRWQAAGGFEVANKCCKHLDSVFDAVSLMDWRDEAKAFGIAYALPLQLFAGLIVVSMGIAGISWLAFTFFPIETKLIKTQFCIASGKCSPPPD